jgi:hypothetical protein
MTRKSKIGYFPGGMTVAVLKEMLTDWPELDENGEPTEVWIETGRGLSSQVREIGTLNARVCDDGLRVADLYLGAAA